MDFTKNIKYALEKRNLTVRDLSFKSDIPEQSLYKMLKNNEYKASTLNQIADALKFGVYNFFEEFETFKRRFDRQLFVELSPEHKDVELLVKESEIKISQNKLDELNQKVKDLSKQIKNLERQLSYSIDYKEFEQLKEEIIKNAVNGNGLVYVDYSLTKETFIKHYKPLKVKISLKDLKNIEFEETFGDLTSNEDNIEFDVTPDDKN